MKNRYIKVIVILGIIFCIMSYKNNVKAVKIDAKENVDISEEVIVTLDFETYIAAYDSFTLEYNDRIMQYNSSYSLIEGLWWDTSVESKGIDKKVYSFTGKGNGTCTIHVKIKGLVSANEQMDNLGDIDISKKIIVGKGTIKGDLNGDGVVNANDAALVLDIYKYGDSTADDIEVADIDGDGVVNANDAALILDMFKYGD